MNNSTLNMQAAESDRATAVVQSLGCPHASPYVCCVRATDTHISTAVPHVSNIEYVKWIDRAAELHSDAAGFTRTELFTRGLMWFVARHEIDYCAECWKDDELFIVTWIREIRRVKAWREYIICRPSDGAIVCRAATLWVLVNLENRSPTRISDEMVDAFQPLSARV